MPKKSKSKLIYIYIMSCTDGKYYVGESDEKQKDPIKYFTKLNIVFKPKSVIKIVESYDILEVDIQTKKYMSLYGIDNVRGDNYFDIILDTNTHDNLKDELNNALLECEKCGEDGHVGIECYGINLNDIVLNHADAKFILQILERIINLYDTELIDSYCRYIELYCVDMFPHFNVLLDEIYGQKQSVEKDKQIYIITKIINNMIALKTYILDKDTINTDTRLVQIYKFTTLCKVVTFQNIHNLLI
jgi:hypothetical protein